MKHNTIRTKALLATLSLGFTPVAEAAVAFPDAPCGGAPGYEETLDSPTPPYSQADVDRWREDFSIDRGDWNDGFGYTVPFDEPYRPMGRLFAGLYVLDYAGRGSSSSRLRDAYELVDDHVDDIDPSCDASPVAKYQGWWNVTVYKPFFYSFTPVERASVLVHEARHDSSFCGAGCWHDKCQQGPKKGSYDCDASLGENGPYAHEVKYLAAFYEESCQMPARLGPNVVVNRFVRARIRGSVNYLLSAAFNKDPSFVLGQLGCFDFSTAGSAVTGSDPVSRMTRPVLTGDFDGNGSADVLTFGDERGAWVSLRNGERYESSQWADFALKNTRLHVGDVNGDGKTDLIRFDETTFDRQPFGGPTTKKLGSVHVGLSNGRSFVIRKWADLDLHGSMAIVVGDFNGDRKADFARFQSDVGPGPIPSAINTNPTGYIGPRGGNPLSLPSTLRPPPFTMSPGPVLVGISGRGAFYARDWVNYSATNLDRIIVGKFNDDDTDDVAILDRTDQEIVVLRSSGAQFDVVSTGVALPGSLHDTGDFNGDGLADLISVERGTPGSIFVAAATGTGWEVKFSASRKGDAGLPARLGTGDFDGDGLTDYLTAEEGCPGTFLVGRSDGTGFSPSRWSWGTCLSNQDRLVVIDFIDYLPGGKDIALVSTDTGAIRVGISNWWEEMRKEAPSGGGRGGNSTIPRHQL
ncbi:MAG: VCBS repeat-containing protein [Deltaproteobacteria bacterium]|nr:VCBS repeat-containing protein [Deltaproteobacteria bacterium]